MRSVMWHSSWSELLLSSHKGLPFGARGDLHLIPNHFTDSLLIKHLFCCNKTNDSSLKYHQVNLKREDASCARDAWFSSQRGLQMSSDTFFLDKRSLLGVRNCCSDGAFRRCTSWRSQHDILRSFYAHPAFLCPRLSVRCRRHPRQIEM